MDEDDDPGYDPDLGSGEPLEDLTADLIEGLPDSPDALSADQVLEVVLMRLRILVKMARGVGAVYRATDDPMRDAVIQVYLGGLLDAERAEFALNAWIERTGSGSVIAAHPRSLRIVEPSRRPVLVVESDGRIACDFGEG